jgi:hypothetical protein
VRNEDEGKGEKGEKGEYRLQRPTGQGTALLNTSEREGKREVAREDKDLWPWRLPFVLGQLRWRPSGIERVHDCMVVFPTFFFAPKSSGVVYPHDPMGIRKDL